MQVRSLSIEFNCPLERRSAFCSHFSNEEITLKDAVMKNHRLLKYLYKEEKFATILDSLKEDCIDYFAMINKKPSYMLLCTQHYLIKKLLDRGRYYTVEGI